ncbi:IS110 family transposase [Enterobacter asburiae]
MKNVTLIGIDIGKHSFHLNGQDEKGNTLFRKKLSRNKLLEFLAQHPVCVIAMEACSGSHYLARKLISFGHDVKLISPQYVKPFVKSNKNDFIDAEAICEAASRPSMRFVKPKTEAQQALSILHRVRENLVTERVKVTNQMHAFVHEFGICLPKGTAVVKRLAELLDDNQLPAHLVSALTHLHEHYLFLHQKIADIDKEIELELALDEHGLRLLSIPGVGPITASLLTSELSDGKQFSRGREFSASLGLVPRQHSTGGKQTLLGISKRGNSKLRALLVQCARAYVRTMEKRTGMLADWVKSLSSTKHSNIVVCALANKLARIAWAIVSKNEHFMLKESMI